MCKRFFQIAAAFVAVALFVLAPLACQQAEKPADTTEQAQPAGPSNGKKLMAAKPKVEGTVEEAGEAVQGAAEETGEAVQGAAEEAGEAAGEAMDKGAQAVEEGAEAVKDAAKDMTKDE